MQQLKWFLILGLATMSGALVALGWVAEMTR